MEVVFSDDTRSVNHASIYLLTEDGKPSIRLNMALPGVNDSRGSTWTIDEMGNYETTHCNYLKSTSSLRDFDLQAVLGLKVLHGK
jgi:hypothetical protein